MEGKDTLPHELSQAFKNLSLKTIQNFISFTNASTSVFLIPNRP